MKRDKKSYPIVKKIKPLFWKECRFCQREFKREQGFRIEDYTKSNPVLYYSYCCSDCCDSVESVKEKIRSSDIAHFKDIQNRATRIFKHK